MLRPLLTALCMATLAWPAGAADPATPSTPALLEESRALAQRIGAQSREELVRELERTGPIRAISVCKYSVPEITSSLSRQSGLRVTRVALRPRNRAVAEPDAWEQQVLLDFEKRIAKGEKAETMEFHAFVDEPAGRAFRYMKAIAVSPPCMVCHGPVRQLAEGVRAQLQLDYPNDTAVEYQVGQLRGAISVKKPL